MNIDQSRFKNQHKELLTSREAAEFLGVRPATLYAYVSRGLVSRVAATGKREHHYSRADLERLRARARARSGHAATAAGALRWGEPVLETAVSSIEPEGPRYRGIAAVDLAGRACGFESAAELLWSGELPNTRPVWPRPRLAPAPAQLSALMPRETPLVAGLALFVCALSLRDSARYGAPPGLEREMGRSLLLNMAAALALPLEPGRFKLALQRNSVAEVVGTALASRGGAAGVRAIDTALVLSADHELNASTFTARVAASTGADLYSCVLAGLASLSGPAHGGACDRVEALVAETARPDRARTVIHDRGRRGEAIPGFGHTLYPGGDPRQPPLLLAARSIPGKNLGLETLQALLDVMHDSRREPPTIDTGLVAVSLALGLPRGSAAALFAIGRAAGWLAHIQEQREAGFLVRPRARYAPARREA